jgi:hypothetical protein
VSVCVWLCLSVCVYLVCLSVSVCLSIFLSLSVICVCQSAPVCLSLSVFLSVCVCLSLSPCLSVFVCPCLSLSVCGYTDGEKGAEWGAGQLWCVCWDRDGLLCDIQSLRTRQFHMQMLVLVLLALMAKLPPSHSPPPPPRTHLACLVFLLSSFSIPLARRTDPFPILCLCICMYKRVSTACCATHCAL